MEHSQDVIKHEEDELEMVQDETEDSHTPKLSQADDTQHASQDQIASAPPSSGQNASPDNDIASPSMSSISDDQIVDCLYLGSSDEEPDAGELDDDSDEEYELPAEDDVGSDDEIMTIDFAEEDDGSDSGSVDAEAEQEAAAGDPYAEYDPEGTYGEPPPRRRRITTTRSQPIPASQPNQPTAAPPLSTSTKTTSGKHPLEGVKGFVPQKLDLWTRRRNHRCPYCPNQYDRVAGLNRHIARFHRGGGGGGGTSGGPSGGVAA